jgi:hypothetical protein
VLAICFISSKNLSIAFAHSDGERFGERALPTIWRLAVRAAAGWSQTEIAANIIGRGHVHQFAEIIRHRLIKIVRHGLTEIAGNIIGRGHVPEIIRHRHFLATLRLTPRVSFFGQKISGEICGYHCGDPTRFELPWSEGFDPLRAMRAKLSSPRK